MPLWQLGAWPNASLALMGKLSSELLQSFQIGFLVSLPVALRIVVTVAILSTLCLIPKRDFVCILRPYARWG